MPDEQHYEAFLSLKEAGRKTEAAAALKAFIQSFDGEEDRAAWARQFLEVHRFGERIRHEVYAEVIFPVLKRGYDRGDAWCLYWLAGTEQNLHAQRLAAQVDGAGSLHLLRKAYEINPSNPDVARELLAAYIDVFAYAEHEWPRGILSGMNGAATEDCDSYLADLAFARTLAPSPEQAAFLATFERKVVAYRGRLEIRA